MKVLDELSIDKLKYDMQHAGLVGKYTEAELVIRLTIYLVKVGTITSPSSSTLLKRTRKAMLWVWWFLKVKRVSLLHCPV